MAKLGNSPLEARRVPVILPGYRMILELYACERPLEVLEWLKRHPFLVPILIDAAIEIRRYFPCGYRLEARMFRSPEDPDADELVAIIRTRERWRTASRYFNSFLDGWWQHRVSAAHSRLTFDVGFED